MKKTFPFSLRFTLFTIFLILPLLMVNTQIPNLETIPTNELLNTKVSRIEDTNLQFFDISDFTNTSHQINVSRSIIANQFGYTSISYLIPKGPK